MTTIAQSLKDMKASLTEENWNKGSYFAEKNNQLCMCVHGAAQAVCNPEVKKIISEYNITSVHTACRDAATAVFRPGAVAAAARAGAADRAEGGIPEIIWKNRPNWVKEDYKDYGNLDIHYLMGMVGLTPAFNDDPSTTFPMLQNKIDEAISLAQQLGV